MKNVSPREFGRRCEGLAVARNDGLIPGAKGQEWRRSPENGWHSSPIEGQDRDVLRPGEDENPLSKPRDRASGGSPNGNIFYTRILRTISFLFHAFRIRDSLHPRGLRPVKDEQTRKVETVPSYQKGDENGSRQRRAESITKWTKDVSVLTLTLPPLSIRFHFVGDIEVEEVFSFHVFDPGRGSIEKRLPLREMIRWLWAAGLTGHRKTLRRKMRK